MRILLVSYYFPPYNSVGAVRPGKLAKFLEQQGHDVRVLTCSEQPFVIGQAMEVAPQRVTAAPSWSINAPIEWLRGGRSKAAERGFGGARPNSVMGRLGRLYKMMLHWPDAQIGWVRSAVLAGRQLLLAEKYDVIYASAPPFSGLRVAARLSRESGVPWVAEMRDLWSDNHAYVFPFWRHVIERRWEWRVLSRASALVTVSPPLAASLKRFGLPVWEVRNGCDPEDFEGLVRPATLPVDRNVLQIVFTGSVYDGHYDVDSFCAGLALFCQQGGLARVYVAGRNTEALMQAARLFNVLDIFDFQAVMPRPTALAFQRYADLLLTFLWDGGTQEGVYSTKLFEYAAAGRPVLAVGQPDSDVGTLIGKAALGQVCSTPEEIARQLSDWQTVKMQAGELHSEPVTGFDFTRQHQFLKLESWLLKLLHRPAE
jgi:glycosyltransferase involved in cell wall biosynthesis